MDNRSRNYSRDVKSYYNGQSPYLRKSRRFEDDRNPDKPTTSAQHPDDFTTSAMKRIFGEDNYRSFDEHSGSREDHDSSQSYCDYITQLADGFMSWIINQVFTSSDHEDYEDHEDHEYHRGHEYHRWQEHHGGHEYHDRDKSNDLKALSPDNQIEKNNKIKEPIAEQKKVAFSDPETGKNEEQRPKSKDRSLHTQKLSDTTGQKTAKQKSVTLAFLEKWKNEEQRPKSKVFNDRSLHTQKLSDTTKQQIAEQKAVTSSYLEKWKNEEQRPKSPEFNELYHLAHDIIKEENTERLLNEKYTKEELIRVIENINRKLQGFAHTQIRNDLKALFSNNVTEKSIAEQKVVTRSYLEKWKDEEQRPKSQRFNELYRRAHDIVNNPNFPLQDSLQFFKLTDWGSQNLSRIFIRINSEFQNFAKDTGDIYYYFSQEKEASKKLIEWAATFQKYFDLRDSWVQTGMKQQLGIVPRYYVDSYNQLKGYLDLRAPSPESYYRLVVAHTKLKYIYELLKDGIPAKRLPDYISRRKLSFVDGKGNNCLIKALLKGANPKWSNDRLEQIAIKLREQLVKDNVAEENDMLVLNDEQGTQLIKNMREERLIERDRGVVAYLYEKGKIQYFPIIDAESNKPPYIVLLRKEHFYAIEVPN